MATILNLADLPNKSRVFVDTNIFYLHYRQKSASCRTFIKRIALGEIRAYVNTLVLTYLLHKLMLAEAYTKGYIDSISAAKLNTWLKNNRANAVNLTDYQIQFEDILTIGLELLPVSRETLISTKMERTNYGLMTGDSLHLGTMNQHSPPLRDVVTHDNDFAQVPNLTIWQPMDVIV